MPVSGGMRRSMSNPKLSVQTAEIGSQSGLLSPPGGDSRREVSPAVLSRASPASTPEPGSTLVFFFRPQSSGFTAGKPPLTPLKRDSMGSRHTRMRSRKQDSWGGLEHDIMRAVFHREPGILSPPAVLSPTASFAGNGLPPLAEIAPTTSQMPHSVWTEAVRRCTSCPFR